MNADLEAKVIEAMAHRLVGRHHNGASTYIGAGWEVALNDCRALLASALGTTVEVDCPRCEGRGEFPGDGTVPGMKYGCHACKRSGKVLLGIGEVVK